MAMTEEQFNALIKMVSAIAADQSDAQKYIDEARKLFVVEPVAILTTGCELCDQGISVSTLWGGGGRQHVFGTIKSGQHFKECTRKL